MTKNIQGILIILHTFIVSLIFYGHNFFTPGGVYTKCKGVYNKCCICAALCAANRTEKGATPQDGTKTHRAPSAKDPAPDLP